ncbi:metallopeptidase family protein [Streptomyces lonarensis]|uniref:Metallopeptidase family protein n=1 Tax=Streptomyces lonarensis TaxID=700599 RepID=A0A7X6I156_9ACTN|nr:metallopeptidase family protein [Streptomyces lonarensis]NJQ08473.1 metallopeptidase family protein [Streptomyces lonarensis]
MSDPSASPSAGRPPGAPAHRHRDRHGRGIRGPLAPPQVPLAASRAETFDGLVLDSADRLRRRHPQLGRVDFEVHEVPETASGEDPEPVPLGRAVPEEGDRPARIVVYRRPVELRARGRDDRAALVHEVVVEQAAELLGLAPESIDPRYGQD